MTDPAIDFILAQTKQNIQFLVSQGALDKEDGVVILGKLDLSTAISQSVQQSVARSPQTTDSAVQRTKTPVHEPPCYYEKISPSPDAHLPVLTSETPLFTVRALWGYNEDGKDEKDLSFRSGDIIEILAETNTDWWLGKLHSREGLLPSTYVEKLPATPPSRPTSAGITMRSASPFYQGERSPSFPIPGGSSYPGGPPYSQGAPYYLPAQGYSAPPPPHFGYAPPQQPPPPGVSIAQGQQAEPTHKHKPGKLGNTLSHSAVGGVGFGAGSAIGGGIIHSIF